jgi:hypothetical protein
VYAASTSVDERKEAPNYMFTAKASRRYCPRKIKGFVTKLGHNEGGIGKSEISGCNVTHAAKFRNLRSHTATAFLRRSDIETMANPLGLR